MTLKLTVWTSFSNFCALDLVFFYHFDFSNIFFLQEIVLFFKSEVCSE